ncbi:uncharacterized protein HD556DRAFT_1536244 [Suillus plorans]|uniref:Uncharacterized protein n=1 Tax=Suillus plorans TaxID=116603 RepID=A0A9P7DIG8_9AGAM|nr:uncharacterized protein HD556DRAFT_1536244 [Suillus plorans]KAG1794145.1 hypothetical protein HD556DRAFT_1536244 [Suillus plorans]
MTEKLHTIVQPELAEPKIMYRFIESSCTSNSPQERSRSSNLVGPCHTTHISLSQAQLTPTEKAAIMQAAELRRKNRAEVNKSESSEALFTCKAQSDRPKVLHLKSKLTSCDMDGLALRTDTGHHLLARYRRTQNSMDLCPMDHPYRPAVLFNLATAKFLKEDTSSSTYLSLFFKTC